MRKKVSAGLMVVLCIGLVVDASGGVGAGTDDAGVAQLPLTEPEC